MTTPPNEPPSDPTQPTPPPYGQPAPSPYGQSTPPQYGQPSYGAPGGPAYGAPLVPGQEPAPSKAMAIWSLVLAIFGCVGITWLVSVILAIIVLVRSKDGRAHGKGLAIAALVINALWLVVGIGAFVSLVIFASNYDSVSDINTGDCLNADGLTGAGSELSNIETVSCAKTHDAEVLGTKTLTADDAANYGDASAASLCEAVLTSETDAIEKVNANGVSVLGVTQSIPPKSGDRLACIAFNSDGSKLTGALGVTP